MDYEVVKIWSAIETSISRLATEEEYHKFIAYLKSMNPAAKVVYTNVNDSKMVTVMIIGETW